MIAWFLSYLLTYLWQAIMLQEKVSSSLLIIFQWWNNTLQSLHCYGNNWSRGHTFSVLHYLEWLHQGSSFHNPDGKKASKLWWFSYDYHTTQSRKLLVTESAYVHLQALSAFPDLSVDFHTNLRKISNVIQT